LKQLKLIIILCLAIWSINLFSSAAEDMLKEPRFTTLLDSLKFNYHNFGDHRIINPPAQIKYSLVGKYPGDYFGELNLSFWEADSLVNSISFANKFRDEIKLSKNRQFCLVKNRNKWDLYDVEGNYVRSYDDMGRNWDIQDIFDDGKVLFYKITNRGDFWFGNIDGVIIVNKDNKIILKKQRPLEEIEIAYSPDYRFTAILEKGNDKNMFSQYPESMLTIYNRDFQQVYQYQFDSYVNQRTQNEVITMVFVGDILLLADRQSYPKNMHTKDADNQECMLIAAVDPVSKQMYQRKLSSPNISFIKEHYYPAEQEPLKLSTVEAILTEPTFSEEINYLPISIKETDYANKDYDKEVRFSLHAGTYKGNLGFYIHNRLMNEIKLDSLNVEGIALSVNGQNALVKINGKWNWYNIYGDYLHSYNDIGSGYRPEDISNSGFVTFRKRDERINTILGTIIVNPQDKIVYQHDGIDEYITACYSDDGKYYAFLIKQTGIEDTPPYSYKHAAQLTVYDDKQQTRYEHYFPSFLNFKAFRPGVPMAFYKHIIIISDCRGIDIIKGKYPRYELKNINIIAVDIETGQALQRDYTVPGISVFPEQKEPPKLKVRKYSSVAESYLEPPKFISILDSLKFDLNTARFDNGYIDGNRIWIKTLPAESLHAAIKKVLSFRNAGLTVKEMTVTGKQGWDYIIPAASQTCFVKNGEMWDYYNNQGEFVRQYPKAGPDYVIDEITPTGHLIFMRKVWKYYKAPVSGIVIMDKDGKIVLRKEGSMQNAEVAISNDSKYFVILSKPYDYKEHANPEPRKEADLTIFNDKFEVVFFHVFDEFMNMDNTWHYKTMSFINHVLFVAAKHKDYANTNPDTYHYLAEMDFAAIDADTGKMYKKRKDSTYYNEPAGKEQELPVKVHRVKVR